MSKNALVEGHRTVVELLKSDRNIFKLYLANNVDNIIADEINEHAKARQINIIEVEKVYLDKISESNNHQGVIAEAEVEKYYELDELIAKSGKKSPFILMLDGITDPQNFGAILRTVDACGVDGVIIAKNRSVSLNSTVARVSAGAAFHVPVARVTNLSQTIVKMQKEGFWVYASDTEGEDVYQKDIEGAILLVIGSEGAGISRLVKEKSDFNISIPLYGHVESLNASVAAAVIMFEIKRKMKY